MTRGKAWQDDFLTVTGWTVNNTGSVTHTFTTDGDILTFTAIFNNAANLDATYGTEIISNGPSSSTYGNLLIRHKENWTASDTSITIEITFQDSTVQDFALPLSTTWRTDVFTVTPGKIITFMNILITSRITGNNNTRVLNCDFIYVFKEMLVLPAVSQPSGISATRNLIELPIPGREGGILQDLGSSTVVVTLNGVLSTTSPNNPSPNSNSYTGLQWVQVLLGVWLEQANPLTTDASLTIPLWQFLSMDAFNYKVVILLFKALQQQGRPDYWDFSLTIKLMPLLGMTAQALGAIQ